MKRYVYKSRVTGHWILDELGMHRDGCSEGREGFRAHQTALDAAIKWADKMRAAEKKKNEKARGLYLTW